MEIKLFEKNHLQKFSVPFNFPVYFTRGLFDSNNPALQEFMNSDNSSTTEKKILIVIDVGVWQCHPKIFNQIKYYFRSFTNHYKICTEPLIVPGGESVKNEWTYVHQVLDAVNKYGIDRHSYIFIIGGGAVLDMACFASAIAHRGIRHVRIPTTVLSQNDSGIGVKNGINLFDKKNFIGTFVPPNAVFNDFEFLETLHERDWRSGIAEAVKVALIKDATFFRRLEGIATLLASRDAAAMQSHIIDCALLHMDHIISGDPFEKGTSRPLDFGHWSAHKLEQMDNFNIRHGEAVAIGIALDSVYSYKQGWLDKKELNRVLNLLHTVGFELYHPMLNEKNSNGQYKLLNGLQEFREHLGGRLTIMFLKNIGHGIEQNEVDMNVMNASLDYLKQYCSK